jgi:twitching motility protein PilT
MELRDLLLLSVQKKASDVHLTYDSPPILRIDGKLIVTNKDPSREELKSHLRMLTDNQKPERDKNSTFTVPFRDGPFPRNIHLQRGSVEAASRILFYSKCRISVCRRSLLTWRVKPNA